MSKVYDFIKECGVFFVLPVNEGMLAGRPFRAIMEQDGKIYISAAEDKSACQQMLDNPHIRIMALNDSTCDWLSAVGKVTNCDDMGLKQTMLETCPVLQKQFTADSAEYGLFELTEYRAELHIDNHVEIFQL